MRYVSALLQDEQYIRLLQRLEELEDRREFCRHDIAHFMDVARIAQLRNLEEHMGQDKEMIYLYALLHDIGRVAEYEQGISHAQASADCAGEILMRLGYQEERIRAIIAAIIVHRGERHRRIEDKQLQYFAELVEWADKESRRCFLCKAYEECKWSETKKNHAEDLEY